MRTKKLRIQSETPKDVEENSLKLNGQFRNYKSNPVENTLEPHLQQTISNSPLDATQLIRSKVDDDFDDKSLSIASTDCESNRRCCSELHLKVLLPLAQHDFNKVLSSLSLFPLKFIESELEKRYAKFIGRTFPLRIRSDALFQSIQILIFWILLGFSMAANRIPAPSQLALPTFHLVESLMFIACSFLFLIPEIPILKRHCEVSVYVVYIMMFSLPLGWSGLISVFAVSESRDTPQDLYEFKHWTDLLNFGLAFLSIFSLDTFYQTRTRFSWSMHIWFWALPIIVSLTQFISFKSILDYTSLTTINVLQIVLLSAVTIQGYWGRWYKELQERVEYYEHTRKADKLRLLQQLHRKRRNTQTSTAAEDLIGLLQKSHRLLLEMALGSTEDHVLETKSLVKEALKIVTNSSSLYTMHIGTEAEPEQQKLLNIYSSNIDSLGTRFVERSHLKLRRRSEGCVPEIINIPKRNSSLYYKSENSRCHSSCRFSTRHNPPDLKFQFDEGLKQSYNRNALRNKTQTADNQDFPSNRIKSNYNIKHQTSHQGSLMEKVRFSRTVNPRKLETTSFYPNRTISEANKQATDLDRISFLRPARTIGWVTTSEHQTTHSTMKPIIKEGVDCQRVLTALEKRPISSKRADYLSRIGYDWRFDFLEFNSECMEEPFQFDPKNDDKIALGLIRNSREYNTQSSRYGNSLLEVGYILLNDYMPQLSQSSECLIIFLQQIQKLYRDNPYHNRLHGAMVGHATICSSRYLGLWDSNSSGLAKDLDFITVAVAALSHDVGHPGRNNLFFVNASDTLALLYNDSAVLENFHCCLTFKVLSNDSSRLFSHLSTEDFRDVRKNIIGMILSTDMSQHFEHVARFRVRRVSPEFNYHKNLEDLWLVLRMCMKIGDLGHAMVDWDAHLKWSLRLAEEFYQQGDAESCLGFPKSPLCNRCEHPNFAKSQKGFLEFVLQPFMKEFECLNQSIMRTELTDRLSYNKKQWESAAEENEVFLVPPEIQEHKTSINFLSPLLIEAFLPELDSGLPPRLHLPRSAVFQETSISNDDPICGPSASSLNYGNDCEKVSIENNHKLFIDGEVSYRARHQGRPSSSSGHSIYIWEYLSTSSDASIMTP